MASQTVLDNLTMLEGESRWQELLENSRRFIKEYSDEAYLGYYYQGVALHEMRQFAEANESYNKSINLNPNYPYSHNALGVLFKDRKKYNEAIVEFDKADRLKPDFLNARINKAQTYSLKGMNEEALVIYNQIIKEDDTVTPVLIFKAECLRELKRTDEAIKVYDQALELEPHAADLHLNKGNIYALSEQNDNALRSYEKAIQSDPQFGDAYYNAGLIYQKIGRDDEALKSFQDAIDKGNANSMPFISLGQLYSKRGNNEIAEKYYQEGIKNHPKSPFIIYAYGIHKIRQNEFEGGIDQLGSAVGYLNENDILKQQYERSLMETKRTNIEIQSKLKNSNLYEGISFSNQGLVSGLDLAGENEGEIPANINILKEKSDDSLSNIEVMRSVRQNYLSLKKENPQLSNYVSSFLLMQNNFIRNTDFNYFDNKINTVNLNLLTNEKLPPSLIAYTKGNQGLDLINKSAHSRKTNQEFKSLYSQLLAPGNDGFDFQYAQTTMSHIVLKKVTSDNHKLTEIRDYEDNSNAKKFITKISQNYPELAADTKDPSTAIALKDFILLNNHLVENNSSSSKNAMNYSLEFEKKYFSGAYEDVSQSKLTGGITTFQNPVKSLGRDLEVTLNFDNKNKASSGSKFIIVVVISRGGKVPPKPDLKGDHFKQVYASQPLSMDELNNLKFIISGQDINDAAIDQVYLKITVFKQKNEKSIIMKVEQNIPINKLNQTPQKLMELKQDKLLSTKIVPIFIKGDRNW